MSKSADQKTLDTDHSNPQLKPLKGTWFAANCLTILYHAQLRRMGERSFLTSLEQGQAASLSRTEPLFSPVYPTFGRPDGEPLMLPSLSRSPLLIVPVPGRGLRILQGEHSKPVKINGADLRVEAFVSTAEIADGVVLELSSHVILLLHRYEMFRNLEEDSRGFAQLSGLIGNSRAMVMLHHSITAAASSDAPVLLRGETGTGKELVAAAIHMMSPRRGRPMVCVNMAALTPSLARAELFGARKGSYTGAVTDQAGLFVRAHQGTLFLDEVGDTNDDVQVMLLRALETKVVQALGDDKEKHVDVRMIAATDADLEVAMDEGRFRAPFFHRLAGRVIEIAPLRERREDLGRLVVYFLVQELRRMGMQPDQVEAVLNDEDQSWLLHAHMAPMVWYHWPGNVRELRNLIGLIVASVREGRGIELLDVPPFAKKKKAKGWRIARALGIGREAAESSPPAPPTAQRTKKLPLPHIDDAAIEAALRANDWEISAAASALGCSRPLLYKRIRESSLLRSLDEIPDAEISAAYHAFGGDINRLFRHLKVSRPALIRRLRRMKLPV